MLLTADEIEAYLRREQPYDCAGSAKCETLGIALLLAGEVIAGAAIYTSHQIRLVARQVRLIFDLDPQASSPPMIFQGKAFFKAVTHLPPFMGILFGLGILWLVGELLHRSKADEEKEHLTLAHALKRIDMSSIIFFIGILLAVPLAVLGAVVGLIAAVVLISGASLGHVVRRGGEGAIELAQAVVQAVLQAEAR